MEAELLASYERRIAKGLKDDDPKLWVKVLETLVTEIALLDPESCKKYALYLQIGVCSHWYRPHQCRWLSDSGSLAYPSGYGGGHSVGYFGLPEHDKHMFYKWSREQNTWQAVPPVFVDKRKLVCRVSIPARTMRHNQAAVQVLWLPGSPQNPSKKMDVLYGFRKLEGEWQCVASDGFPEIGWHE